MTLKVGINNFHPEGCGEQGIFANFFVTSPKKCQKSEVYGLESKFSNRITLDPLIFNMFSGVSCQPFALLLLPGRVVFFERLVLLKEIKRRL